MPSWKWFAKLKNIKFSVVILILQGFLLVNAPLIVQSSEVGSYQTLLVTYMILLLGFEAFVDKGAFGDRAVGSGLLWFGIGLLGGSLLFAGGGYVIDVVSSLQAFAMARDAPLVLLLTQSIVVAATEEQVFRNYAPAAFGIVPSQIAFGLFHAAAYGLAFSSILIAMVAGFAFYILARSTSIWTAVGVHASFNLYVLGVI